MHRQEICIKVLRQYQRYCNQQRSCAVGVFVVVALMVVILPIGVVHVAVSMR
jgi:hypothetical protein